jgi:23S rRNA (guanosine2251-2'-O)-methyltransferase
VSRKVVGINAVRAALRERPEDVEKLYLKQGGAANEIASIARKLGLEWVESTNDQLVRLSEGQIHQGVVAEVREFRYHSLDELVSGVPEGTPPLIVILDGIEDPQNLGAILRSVDVLGAHGVVIPKDRAASVTPAVARAAAGAVETVRIAQVVNLSRALDDLKEKGLWIAVADQEATQPVWEADLRGPIGIVIGAEGKGVRPLVKRHCDLPVRIPMVGTVVGSLNASVSAGLMLYEAMRQRAQKK